MPLADNPEKDDVVDWSAALDYAGGDEELLGELIQMFLDEAPQRMADIVNAAGAGDAKSFHLAAHTLKSALRLFSAMRGVDLAYQLEMAGKQQQLAGTDDVVRQLQQEVAAVIETVRRRVP